MQDFTRTRSYIFILTAIAAVVALSSALALGNDVNTWVLVLVLALIIALLDILPIGVGRIEMTVSEIVEFASVLLFPAPVVILSVTFGTALGETRSNREWFKRLFNVSALTVTWAAVVWVYTAFHQPATDYFGSVQNILAWILAGLTEFTFNLMLVALAISLASKLPVFHVLSKSVRQLIWPMLSMTSLGVFLAVLWRYNPLSSLLIIVPALGMRHSYVLTNQLQEQTRDALVALMEVIDERDQHTYDHSKSVSRMARAIADTFDLSQEQVETIASAALLHDLGKVGMADGILFSPRPLTTEEQKGAQRHAEIGATLLSKFPLFQGGSLLVRHHHEHFDGTGYPDGLKGEAIPLGARIISICDAYHAMTEERPYRRAFPRELAIEQIKQASGSQFDPQVVQAFLQVLATDDAQDKPVPAPKSPSTMS